MPSDITITPELSKRLRTKRSQSARNPGPKGHLRTFIVGKPVKLKKGYTNAYSIIPKGVKLVVALPTLTDDDNIVRVKWEGTPAHAKGIPVENHHLDKL